MAARRCTSTNGGGQGRAGDDCGRSSTSTEKGEKGTNTLKILSPRALVTNNFHSLKLKKNKNEKIKHIAGLHGLFQPAQIEFIIPQLQGENMAVE